jgi:hypothetical protein
MSSMSGKAASWRSPPMSEKPLQLAEQLTGAAPGRWVNFAVAGEDYLDYVRARGETTA